MAITALGTLGTAQERTTDRSISLSPSRDVPAGRFLALWYANDSIFNSGQPTTGWNFFRCNDDVENTWAAIASYTDQRCFFSCGAVGILYVCQLAHDLTTADTITIDADTGHDPGSAWAKAMSLEEFDLGADMRWCVERYGAGQQDDTSDPTSIGLGLSGGTREVLWLHLLGAEGPVTDTYTWDPNYTQIVAAGTNTGTPTDDIHVDGGYRIAQILSDTVSVQSDTADRDYVQCLNAVWAVPAASFPTTPILDDFNRADEDPLDNGTWLATGEMAYSGSFAKLSSNQAMAQSGQGGSWWLDEWSGCTEAHMTIPVFDLGATILTHGSGSSHNSTLLGSGASWRFDPGDLRSFLNFGENGFNGLVTGGVAHCQVEGDDGYQLGIQRIKGPGGDYIDHLWIDRGNDWEEIAARSINIGIAVHLAGKPGIGLHGGNDRVDDFGGGEIVCPVSGKPQIMRYV